MIKLYIPHRLTIRAISLSFTLLLPHCLSGCLGNSVPEVTRTVAGRTESLPLTLSLCTGKRDGYFAEGEMLFTKTPAAHASPRMEIPDSLLITLKIEAGVPARFISGRYTLITRSARFRGSITAEALNFFGGQGGLPSIGGRFSFTTEYQERYEVHLPATEMKNPGQAGLKGD